MREGVVADDVTGLNEFAREFGTLPHVVSDQKKSCANVVLRKNLEQPECLRIIRAVIEGQGELAGAGQESGECLSVPLRGRRHGLITGGNRGGERDGCAGKTKHKGIVTSLPIADFQLKAGRQ